MDRALVLVPRPVEYNFKDQAQLEAENVAWRGWSGEQPGTSAFLRHGDRVFHTYSSYARGGDLLEGLCGSGRASWVRPCRSTARSRWAAASSGRPAQRASSPR